jgi:glycosyltransferase involved in cell wall biosynthesis
MFSTVILTLNEERNLPGCLASLAGCDDVTVLDSGSTDRTTDIARASGAKVLVNPFFDFAQQRNHAQRAIPFRHRWVFHLDADEQMTPELLAEARAAVATPEAESLDGFYVAPKMLWEGRWIPRCTDYPAWQARLVRAPQFEFVEVGHGQREAPGMKMGRLRASYLHDLSAGGVDEWLAKHRRYARAEAAAHAREAASVPWGDFFSSESLRRRRALKRLSYTLPGRPALRFFYQYLLRGGLLDGTAGLRYCRLLARYEGFAAAELRKLRRTTPP